MYFGKVVKILKGNLDSILSSSANIQIMGGRYCLWYKGKTLLGIAKIQAFENKKFVEITQHCFALLPQVNFDVNNVNFY